MYAEFSIFFAFAFLYALVAHRIESLPLSGPIVFLFIGFLSGPFGFGLVDIEADNPTLRMLADFTLAIFLFVDAAKTKLHILERNYHLPMRMLLIGLPGSIALGFLAAYLFRAQLSLAEMALLGVMLAATDAALGKPVVNNSALPDRLRTSLSVESGLNDGLAVPLLLFFIAVASNGAGDAEHNTSALSLIAHEVGIGLVIGLSISPLGSWLLKRAKKHNWIEGSWTIVPTVMLALICFGTAQSVGGSGYIAAFVGGLAYREEIGDASHYLLEQAEGIGEVLAMATWLFVGLVGVGLTLPYVDWAILAYAALSLTVVRILPIFASLAGTGENAATKLFLGWFGPRGLASIVFVLIVLSSNVPNAELLATIVTTTVIFSVILHGVTATPFSNAFAAKIASEINKARTG